jgi:hypothetical protein
MASATSPGIPVIVQPLALDWRTTPPGIEAAFGSPDLDDLACRDLRPGSIRHELAVAHVACFAQEQGERSIQVIKGRDGEGMKVQRPGQRLDVAD